MILATLLLALLPAAASISGTVRAQESREPIAGATVEIPELRRRAVTDERGYFVLAGVPAGQYTLRADALGFRRVERPVSVPETGSVRVDLELTPQATELAGIEVQTERGGRTAARGGPGATRLDSRTVNTVPALAEADVMRALQVLPSVAAASDFSSALYVRGGSPDQNLVMLDGTPLFNPYHLGGIFGAIDPSTVASVDLLAGAFPARVGDRLSGVVDIRTREGGRDKVRGNGAVSLISSRASVDGPLPTGRGSYLFSVRRTYLDAFTDAAYALDLIPGTLPYGFTDGHLKLSHDVGTNGQVSASVYLNDEGVNIPERMRRETGVDVQFDWGSRLATVAYRHTFGPALVGEFRAAATQFLGTFAAAEDEWDDELQRQRDEFSPILSARTEARDLLAAADLTWYRRTHRVRTGVQFDAYRFAHRVEDLTENQEAFGPFVVPFRRSEEPRTLAAYVDDEWSPTRSLDIRAGLRVLHAGAWGTEWMPRVGARWAVLPELALSFGAGRYAQVIQSLRNEESLAASLLAYELLAASPQTTGLLTGEDVVVGAEWAHGVTSVRVDAYVKRLHNLPLPPTPDDILEAPVVVSEGFRTAEGSARGLELLARHARGAAQFSLAYALLFAEREIDGERFAPRFERRHTVDALALLPLGTRGEFSARLAVATGQPYTPVLGVGQGYRYDPGGRRFVYVGDDPILLGAHNSGRLPGYLRLDVGARRTYEKRWFGGNVTLTPYLQILNVLNTRNVLFAEPQASGYGPAVLEYAPQLPIFPTVGVEWKF